ncbi:MAG: hypothetical protein ABIU58_03690 [Ramlibacter sp.]
MEAQALAAMAFVDPEVLSLPAGTVERFIAEAPGLDAHRPNLQYLPEMELLATAGIDITSAALIHTAVAQVGLLVDELKRSFA